jgi:hypothetical protein
MLEVDHMKALLRRLILCSALLIGTSTAAQEPPPKIQEPAQRGAGPQARPELRRLAFLLGGWEEEITYAGREAGSDKGRGRWLARPDLGRYLNFRYEGSGPEGDYHALGLLTWDAESQSYRMWWFDDSGGAGEYRGNFRDENTLVLEHRGKVEGRDFRERITYTRAGPGEVRTKIEQAYGDEEWKTYLEATAHRMRDQGRPGQGRLR